MDFNPQAKDDVIDISTLSIQQQKSIVFVKKQREHEYELKIAHQWRQARAHFFSQHIPKILNQAQIDGKVKQNITEQFLLDEGKKLEWLLWFDNNLVDNRTIISQLVKKIIQINKSFIKKQSECPPLRQIIESKITTLEVIHIDYQPKLHYFEKCYSISAFDLFRVVHENKQLKQVTLKGVTVQHFQEFINILNSKKIEEQQRWISDFNPQKSLKFTAEGKLQFDIQKKQACTCFIGSLAFFVKKFHSLSDIRVKVKLGKQVISQDKGMLLQLFWRSLKALKNIKIQIQESYQRMDYEIPFIRSSIFGGLASFTEISYLSFKNINFNYPQGHCNGRLAIEQILVTLFRNNTVLHLEFIGCQILPTNLQINSLQSIQIRNMRLSKSFSFMNKLSLTNPQLKSIKCQQVKQQWRIGEKLFDKLEGLCISNSSPFNQYISLQKFTPIIPSNIIYLRLTALNITNTSVSYIFPKLSKIKYLSTEEIRFGHQILCLIPSQLEFLQMMDNTQIKGEGIRQIDLKWPFLKFLSLLDATSKKGEWKLFEKIWSTCEFKGLMKVRFYRQGLTQVSRYFRRKGIIVQQV